MNVSTEDIPAANTKSPKARPRSCAPNQFETRRLPGAQPMLCASPFMPGVDSKTFVAAYAAMGEDVGHELLAYPHTAEEPPLRCYVSGSC